MADKEVHHYSSGDGGAGGMIAVAILVAVLVVGGLFVWNYAGSQRSAGGPNVTITTGQGGQGGGGGMSAPSK